MLKGYKVFLAALVCLAMGSVETWGQCATWTRSTIRNCDGIDYELWSQNNRGTVNMQITGGDSNPNGGTFAATWSGTENILFRAGKKWGFGTTTTARDVGTISLDFAATWDSRDNVKMLGIYGWAYYPEGSEPTKAEDGQNTNFSNQIEYYIIQDRGGFNPGASGVNAKKYGEATIDGIAYDFWVADRINQPMLTGRGNFKQYFSVPQNTSSHRQSGVVTISKHFEEWDKAGMKMMDCPLYEVAMKVESYTGSPNGGGSASVTKNLLTLGGTHTAPSDSIPPSSLSRGSGTTGLGAGNTVAFVQGRTLNVQPLDGAPLRIRVRDVNGKSRFDFTTPTNTGAATFSLEHVPAGRYVLDVTGAAVKQVTPVVLW